MENSSQSLYNLCNYDFSLPRELIADRPVHPRDHSRLLVYHQGQDKVEHRFFYEIIDYLRPQDIVFFNNSKVFPSRLLGRKLSGGKAEVLLVEPKPYQGKFLVMLRSNGKKSFGDKFDFEGLELEVVDHQSQGMFWVKAKISDEDVLKHFQEKAMLAIPPYIRKGMSDDADKKDYQTVYAADAGSVAAPTAGLHFTNELLEKIKLHGVEIETLTLNVGPGTFLPIEAPHILDHQMHSEYFHFPLSSWQKLKNAKGKKIAVGTTTLRVLESTFHEYKEQGLTNIFLYPGKKIESIDGLMTNFHLPKSTLMILVSALIGIEKTKELYQIAIDHKYRFFSYGDAMLILR